jgi:YVTN family beta-propeller protein
VIDTASNTVVATVPVGLFTQAVAVTPDGKHAYAANASSPGTVSVIATTNNHVVATVAVGNGPVGVGIIPDIPFSAFSAKLEIDFHGTPNESVFKLRSSFTLVGRQFKGNQEPGDGER